MRVNKRIRKAVNSKLYELLRGYRKDIPLTSIDSILNESGMWMVDEAGNRDGFILCGDNSNATFDMMSENGLVMNSMLWLSWYKMTSGRYEVIAYIT